MSFSSPDLETTRFLREIKVAALDYNTSSHTVAGSGAGPIQSGHAAKAGTFQKAASTIHDRKPKQVLFRWRRARYCWQGTPFCVSITMLPRPKAVIPKTWLMDWPDIKQVFVKFLVRLALLLPSNWRIKRPTGKRIGESYQYLLEVPTYPPIPAQSPSATIYDPLFLDNPEIRTRNNQSIVCLPCIVSSLTPYTKAQVLKRILNEEFRRAHLHSVHPSITLSKIRSLRRMIVEASEQSNLEIATAARAYTFVEKLVLCKYITKSNRKLVAAVCLLLAKKLDDPVDKSTGVDAFFTICERHFSSSKVEMLGIEIQVLAALRFDLQIPEPEFFPHFERIINTLEYSNIQEYLGERMYRQWKHNAM